MVLENDGYVRRRYHGQLTLEPEPLDFIKRCVGAPLTFAFGRVQCYELHPRADIARYDGPIIPGVHLTVFLVEFFAVQVEPVAVRFDLASARLRLPCTVIVASLRVLGRMLVLNARLSLAGNVEGCPSRIQTSSIIVRG